MRTNSTVIILALFCSLVLAGVTAAASTTINPLFKYAWSENGGWSNFTPTNGGIAIFDDHLEGYAWNEGVGWIKLGSHTGGGAYTYGNSTASNWGVNLGSGSLSGFGWSENAGWIKFNPTGGGVTINSGTGAFDGYAWSESIGWIHFKNTLYNVRQMLNQTITFGTALTLVAGDSATVSATATSGLTPVFASTTPDVCTLATAKVEWTNSSLSKSWRGIASSSDGRRLVAAAWDDYLYTSDDYGATWTAHMTDVTRWWYQVASSADGRMLVATVYGGSLYTSTDAGVTWTAQANALWGYYTSVASSADGVKLAAVRQGYNIRTSTDAGATWTERANTAWGWTFLASSADGTKLVATVQGISNGYYSSDSGATWTASNSVTTTGNWSNVASSLDGTKLVSSVAGTIYTSTNSGQTWNKRSTLTTGAGNWLGVTSSADGSRLVAVGNDGHMYVSNDYGVTWTSSGSYTIWESVALTSDGGRLAAASGSGTIHSYADSTTVTALKAGTCTITADQSGNLFHNAAPQATQSFTIAPCSYIVTGSVTLGSGSISCDSPVTSGNPSVCTLSTDAGWYIAGLKDNTVDVALSQIVANKYTISPVTASHTVTATFQEYFVRRISGGVTSYHLNLTDALKNAANGDSILMLDMLFPGAIAFDQAASITVNGGYASGFGSNTGTTVLNGKVAINGGKVVMKGIKVK